MKKTMKTMLALVAGALCLTGCEQENLIEDVSNARLITLTASQEGENVTRAAIDGSISTQINWTTGDQINYFGGATGESMTLDAGSNGKPSGTFTGTVTTGTQDYVLYPYQASATCTSGVITAEVPMTQYAVANSFDPAAALMVGEVQSTSVQFKNVMSYVKVTIPSGMTTCKQVVLKAKDAWTTVAGKVKITASTAEWAETYAKEGEAFVRLVPKSPATTLTAGASYYIAILPQTMATGFELIFNDNDVIKVKQSASSSVTFARKTTKKLAEFTNSEFTYTVSAITMTPTLKVADRNIGASAAIPTVNSYGDCFAWAAKRPAYITKALHAEYSNVLVDLYKTEGFTIANAPYRSSSAYTKYTTSDGKTTLDAEDDIAALLWGGKWRMPTKEELTALIENKSWSSGLYCTISGGNVFLPLAGYCHDHYLDQGRGEYWSSSSGNNNMLYFNSDYQYMTNGDRNYGYTVRPVLDVE